LMDVTVTLTAELGRTTLTLGEVLRLGSGVVVPLDRLVPTPREPLGRLLARPGKRPSIGCHTEHMHSSRCVLPADRNEVSREPWQQ